MKIKLILIVLVSLFSFPLFSEENPFLNLYNTELITSDALSFHLEGKTYPRSLFFPGDIQSALELYPESKLLLESHNSSKVLALSLFGAGYAVEIAGMFLFLINSPNNQNANPVAYKVGLGMVLGSFIPILFSSIWIEKSEQELYLSINTYNQEKIRAFVP